MVKAIVDIAESVDAWIIADEVYRGAELNQEECTSFWEDCSPLRLDSICDVHGISNMRAQAVPHAVFDA